MRTLPWLLVGTLLATDVSANDGFRKRWKVSDTEALLRDGWKKHGSEGRTWWSLSMEDQVLTPFWKSMPNHWAIEARIRIGRSKVPEGCVGGAHLHVNDGRKWVMLVLGVDSFRLWPSDTHRALDTTKDFHVFRIEARDEKLALRIDGRPEPEVRFSSDPPLLPRQVVSFGHLGTCYGLTATWDYVQLESTPLREPAPAAIAPEPGPPECPNGYLVERCMGQGVACTQEHPCAPARCSTSCESSPPVGDGRGWSCHGEGRRYRCSALIPGVRRQ